MFHLPNKLNWLLAPEKYSGVRYIPHNSKIYWCSASGGDRRGNPMGDQSPL